MGRKQIKPNYDPEKIQNELVEICRSLCIGDDVCYGREGGSSHSVNASLRKAADELGISVSKVVKLLITGGYYSSDISERIASLYGLGKTIPEIQAELEVSRSTVQSYLPYKKGIYNAKEVSLNAERIRKYRERQACVKRLQEEMSEDVLWESVVAFQGYSFKTMRGLPFFYFLKVGRNGAYNRELIVNRRKESKTLAWSSVRLAFERAKEMKGEEVPKPKALGDIRGISYVYAMFLRWGIVVGK